MHAKRSIIAIVAIAVALGLYFYSPEAKAPTPEQSDVADDTSEAKAALEQSTTTALEPREPEAPTNQRPAPAQATYSEASPEPESTTIDLPYNKIVVYDGKGFIPEELEIAVGNTVRFVNLSEEEKMWVASANHPSHKIYPVKNEADCNGSSFDQCEGVALGGSWNFTFDRLGSWRYHNHERPRDDGVIHVLQVEEYLRTRQ